MTYWLSCLKCSFRLWRKADRSTKWSMLKHRLLNAGVPPLVSWSIHGFLNWDLWILWLPTRKRRHALEPLGWYRIRIHFALAEWDWKRRRFKDELGGAGGTRIGFSVWKHGYQIGFDNHWEGPDVPPRWQLIRLRPHQSVRIIGTFGTWRPPWYPAPSLRHFTQTA